MSLKKCKDCGHEVSKRADKCPNCGAPTKPKSIGCGGLILIIFIIGIFGSIFSDTSSDNKSPNQPDKPKTQAEIRKERIEKGFSAWDGSHSELTKLVKQSMNDPDSYDHAETVYWDKGDHLIVKTTFRGKNAFGGTVKNWVKAKADLDGNVIAILEQGP